MTELRADRLRAINFWDKLFELRDKDRADKKDALVNILAKDLPLEINRQGLMYWYLHPLIDDTVIKPFTFYVQEIPPGSRSGRLKVQGGQIFYVWEGRGYTTLDGAKHPWEAGAVLQLPLRPLGVIYQHFNEDPDNRVRLIAVEPNTAGALGMDRGCGFEQLENCPEYEARRP